MTATLHAVEPALAAPTDEDPTLFASRDWLDHWLAAFATESAGWWPSATDASIAYQLQRRRIGPFVLRVAAGASNSHTPRFDVVDGGTLGARSLERMMSDLDVCALAFPYVSERSRLARNIEALAAGVWHRDPCEVAPFVDCSHGSVDDYLESRGKTRRKTWLYYERRSFKADGRFEMLADWPAIEPLFDRLLEIEASGWKGRAGGAIARDDRVRSFYQSLCARLAGTGRLRVFLLYRGSELVAFQICTLHAGTLSCLKIGYLESYAHDSPGQVLQLQIIRWANESPDVRIFDLLGPASETKLKWATGTEALWTYYVFRRSPGGMLARLRWKHAPLWKASASKWLPARRATPPTQPAADE